MILKHWLCHGYVQAFLKCFREWTPLPNAHGLFNVSLPYLWCGTAKGKRNTTFMWPVSGSYCVICVTPWHRFLPWIRVGFDVPKNVLKFPNFPVLKFFYCAQTCCVTVSWPYRWGCKGCFWMRPIINVRCIKTNWSKYRALWCTKPLPKRLGRLV